MQYESRPKIIGSTKLSDCDIDILEVKVLYVLGPMSWLCLYVYLPLQELFKISSSIMLLLTQTMVLKHCIKL